MRSRLGGRSEPSSFINHLDNTFSPGEQQQHHSLHNDISFDDGPTIDNKNNKDDAGSGYGYKVYKERWVMLGYLSLLNLLSDWTGLSVAPIATITSRAYGSDDDYIYANDNNMQIYIQPEALVTVFLIASSIGTALEPWVLSRLGLRRTVVFGAFSNMLGNLIKSGGLPPFFTVSSLLHGIYGTGALYLGFFLVGFAQPLFQCTPALLSASWFPEEERTLATSIALNANQLGVGLAFIVGALYVQSPNQIASYFSLLSLLSIFAFVGVALQLEDAPPTPPSGSSRIMRGTLEVSVRDIIQRASSSLLVKDAGGKYDIDVSRLWGYCGDEGDAKSTVSASSSAVNESANSLLRRHITRGQDDPSSQQQQHSIQQPSILANPYSTDESCYFPDDVCDGAEPTLTQTPHHLEINIRDDQVFLAAKACFSRKGFPQALVVFSCVGIVINVLSTYLDYLVRGDYYGENENANYSGEITSGSIHVAVIGALFQVIIMVSSIVVGSLTDKTRSYFIVTLVLMVLGVLALAECGVSLDKDRDRDVRWTMLVVAGLLGPLLPVATELAVELAYPLSENTVLVVLQLSCNLLSALFIPLFQSVRDVGVSMSSNNVDDDDGAENVLGSGRPPYTFSFYLLIIITCLSTVYFATFNGKYLRYEAELAKKRGDFPAEPRRPLV